MNDLNLFVPITKIDAAQRLVYGVVTAEKPDGAGEVCDYASTKPLYQQWSQKFASATDGRSLGNLRAMHGAVAAGKLVDIAFNDDARQVEICGKVVDDAEWQKVEEGVYTGFSQGGRYVKRWPDPDRPSLTRYTAEPLEVSLVDNPCLPEATFAVIKADGSRELRKFKAVDHVTNPSLRGAERRSNPESVASRSGLLRGACHRAGHFGPDPLARNDEETLAKIGARHSKADKDRIKAIHDLLANLDPDCCPHPYPPPQAGEGWEGVPGANVEPNPRFPPPAGEHGEEAGSDQMEKLAAAIEHRVERPLTKAIHSVTARLDDMTARMKKIEDQPLPLGSSSVRVVEKHEDSQFAAPAHLLDRPGALEALAEFAIRKAQSSPMRAMPGFRPRTE